MANKYPFEPDYSVAPGATLKETLDARGISQSDLAVRTGMAEKTISQIINGIAPITVETAEKLELVLSVPARFWNRRELSYRESLARLEAVDDFNAEVAWLDEIPVKTLRERLSMDDHATKPQLVRLALKFFGVSSVDAWRNVWECPAVQYRGQAAQKKRPGYVAAWLRMGELQAESILTEPFEAGTFRQVLADVRDLTLTPATQWAKEVPRLCASAGVAVVFTKEIPTAGVSGATRWVTKDKVLMQLSLKYKSDDQFWFSLFHEAGHVLLHGKKQVFIEYGTDDATDEEKEANRFARDWLIPSSQSHKLPYLRNRAQIRSFAHSIEIAPGIVVGRLQHDKLVFPSAFNDLKRKLNWAT